MSMFALNSVRPELVEGHFSTIDGVVCFGVPFDKLRANGE
jgi:hypothetical protein